MLVKGFLILCLFGNHLILNLSNLAPPPPPKKKPPTKQQQKKTALSPSHFGFPCSLLIMKPCLLLHWFLWHLSREQAPPAVYLIILTSIYINSNFGLSLAKCGLYLDRNPTAVRELHHSRHLNAAHPQQRCITARVWHQMEI